MNKVYLQMLHFAQIRNLSHHGNNLSVHRWMNRWKSTAYLYIYSIYIYSIHTHTWWTIIQPWERKKSRYCDNMDGPEGIMLNEVSQTENDKYCTASLTFRTKTNKSNFEKQSFYSGVGRQPVNRSDLQLWDGKDRESDLNRWWHCTVPLTFANHWHCYHNNKSPHHQQKKYEYWICEVVGVLIRCYQITMTHTYLTIFYQLHLNKAELKKRRNLSHTK